MTVLRVDQGMAAAAARVVPPEVDKELRTRYRQLRIMLHTAGLAATYAFIASKARDAGRDPLATAYQKAGEAIRDRIAGLGLLPGDVRELRDVLARLGEMGAADYARASAEATAFTGWLSRLGDALYQEREDDA
jgi:CRISPR type III-B/RAMP module-associated protein Cmr5